MSFSQSVRHISRRFAHDEYLDHFYQLKASNGEVSFSVSTALKWAEFNGFICIANRYFVSSDVNGSTAGMDVPYYDRDSCCYKALLDFAADLANNCSKGGLSTMYDRITSAMFAQDDVLHFSKLFFVAVFCFCLTYLLLDLYERCYFVYVSIVNKPHTQHMITAVLGTKVPGSYLRKQMSILSVSLILSSYGVYYIDDFSDEVHKYYVQLATTSLVLRFIMHIHSLRLLPGIGQFVITTFMMGNNLLHFSVVFTIVVFVFSAIFYMILTNTECPVEKLSGFQSLIASMFSTFQLTFGHGDITVFYSNIPAKVSYVMYIVIMGLLLMNLIIAIMSSTATDVMQEPWRETLWHMGWLEEALSAEFTIHCTGTAM